VIVNGQSTACTSQFITASALASGGTPGYTYQWTGPSGFTSTNATISINVFPQAAGTYTVSVVDGNGCTGVTVWSLVVNDPVVSLTSIPVSCFGGCDGSITANVSGGQSPFTYNWSPSSINTPTLTNACSGAYTVTVMDSNGCLASGSTTVTQASPIFTSLNVTQPSTCGACDGSVYTAATGGTTPYVYLWNNGSTTANQQNLCPGIYQVTVVDANGCMSSDTAVMNNSTIQTSFTIISDSCNQGVGSISLNATNTVGNVTYNWMPGNFNTQMIASLHGGVYTVTIQDSSCAYTQSVTVPNYNQITLVANVSSPVNCGGNTGSIAVTANGPNPPFLYSIDGVNYVPSNIITGLAVGSYTVYAKDATGCVSNGSVVYMYNSNSSMVSFTTGSAACSISNGSATAYANNLAGPYTYLWQPGGQTTQTITNLGSGNYTCTITGAGGCSAMGIATINQQTNVYLSYSYNYYNCGVNSLTATAYYGTPPYTYLWQPGNQTTQTITNQNTGTYTCTVTDASGCSAIGYYGIYNSTYSTISGVVYNDVNTNCVYDASDSLLPGWNLTANNSGNNYGYTYTNNGNYNMYVPSGINTYTVNAYAPNYWYNTSNYYQFNCSPATVNLTQVCSNVQNVNIGVTTIPAQDLNVYLYCGTARPGFQAWYSISYVNHGTITVPNAVVSFDLDPLLTFSGSTPIPTSISGHHFEFNVGTLTPGQSGWIYVNGLVPTIQNGGALGTPITNAASIDPIVGDFTPNNNSYSCSTVIVGSYDPNEKNVYAEGMDATGAIDTAGRTMYYNVQFQNTGTDTAFTVTVRDTISELLDLSSLEMLTASHAYTVKVLPSRVLEVTFSNILLVDSNRNEALSHGYFNFRIHTVPTIQHGDNIQNTADIYFDFNLPVITNTVNTPVLNAVGIKEISKPLYARVHPNPSNGEVMLAVSNLAVKQMDIKITSLTGELVYTKSVSNTSQYALQLAHLANGVYFIHVMDEKGNAGVSKVIIAR
jgi:uncharacterized repeat protein (TIGR01451 family)